MDDFVFLLYGWEYIVYRVEFGIHAERMYSLSAELDYLISYRLQDDRKNEMKST